MTFVKKIVIKNPIINNKFAKGNTSFSSSPSFKYYSIASADSGKICIIATLINKEPANVVPIDRSIGFDLKAADRRGNVPTNVTMTKNNTIKATFKMMRMVYSFIKIFI